MTRDNGNTPPRVIAVFGSARVDPGDEVYEASAEVGQALARAGYTVMTGGYEGVMAAASRGAAEADGHVIGVTVRALELVRESRVNAWVHEEVKYDTLRERLHHLVDQADGYIVMPGGVGTLQELAEVWQLMRLRKAHHRPLICYGDFWLQLLEDLVASRYVGLEEKQFVDFVENTDEMLDSLKRAFARQATMKAGGTSHP